MAAPGKSVIWWNHVATNTRPVFTIHLPHRNGTDDDAAAGDIAALQYSARGEEDWQAYASKALTADEADPDVGSQIAFYSVPALAEGLWDFRFRLERGAEYADWSPTEKVTVQTTAPVIASVSPDGLVGVSLVTTITINFNRGLFFGTGNIYIKKYSDDTIVETFSVTDDVGTEDGQVHLTATRLRIFPSLLEVSTKYYVTIDDGALYDRYLIDFPGLTDKDVLTWTTETTEFDPADLFTGGYEGFIIDPSVAGSLYQERTSPTTLADTDGEVVGYAVDQSGYGAHFNTFSADANRPVYHTAGGVHWLTFGQSSDLGVNTASSKQDILNNAPGATMLFAGQITDDSVVRYVQRMMIYNDTGANATRLGMLLRHPTIANGQHNYLLVGVRGQSGDTFSGLYGTTHVSGADQVWSATYDGATRAVKAWINHDLEIDGTASNATAGNFQNTNGAIEIGNQLHGAFAQSWNGKMYLAFEINRALTDIELLNLRTYAMRKFQ